MRSIRTQTAVVRSTINAPLPILRYDPRKEDFERWFGPTEAKIMEILWGNQPMVRMTVRSIQRCLDREYSHAVAYTTVMSTMTRLWEKGVLGRIWQDGAYAYAPRESAQEFEDRQIAAIRESLS
ncbi:MAG: BlaI/MecI/CopY family transcriptional regulator [Kouleothrix sp.]|jgi:predicted transcriptional regulator|nr:BlaI/MecI/CopY family transcriptional regulator [Kouleothrix sp.]